MTHALKIDFVSDVSCPWCAIGLATLRQALDRLQPEVLADVRLQPFELNRGMAEGGQDIAEHLSQKYGSTPEQQAQVRATLHERGAEVGFEFASGGRGRIYNTRKAHRLLHWAGLEHTERQLALKQALLQACHRDQLPMDADDVLLDAVENASLDRERAIDILAGNEFDDAVGEREAFYLKAGVNSVPTMIVEERYVISGARPVEMIEQALRQIAAQVAGA